MSSKDLRGLSAATVTKNDVRTIMRIAAKPRATPYGPFVRRDAANAERKRAGWGGRPALSYAR